MRDGSRLPAWFAGVAAVLLTAAVLVVVPRLPGLIIAGLLGLVLAGLAARATRQDSTAVWELADALGECRREISDVLGALDDFTHSPEADHLADRTLKRPALLDEDSAVPEIARFYQLAAGAEQFLSRLDKLSLEELSAKRLRGLLHVADERAAALQQAWRDARERALELGPEGGEGAH